MLISELLQKKYQSRPYEAVTCNSTDEISKAVARMAEHNIGAVVVRDDDSVVGIFTERDVMQGLHSAGADFLEGNLKTSMITKVVIMSPDQTMDEALDLMNKNRFRHLPVMDQNQLVGLLSIRDLIAHKLDRIKSTAEFLQQQVQTGSKPLPM